MKAMLEHGDVDIDDVSVLQGYRIRHSVADDLVDRSANRLGISMVADASGDRITAQDEVIGDAVEFFGRDAGAHVLAGVLKGFGSEATGLFHESDIGGGFDDHWGPP